MRLYYMKRTSATYTHSTIGFPAIVLKWQEEDGAWLQPYVTLHGVIQPPGSLLHWQWKTRNPALYAADEMAAFDSFIRAHFSEDASVQG